MNESDHAARTHGEERARRPTWQQLRRAENRQAILEGARRVFAAKGYFVASVDDILREAGIGRTSFYKHFDDKLAVVAELFDAFFDLLEGPYSAIGSVEDVDRAALEDWLRQMLEFYAANAGEMRVFAQAMLAEPGFGLTIVDIQRRLMAILGERFAAFRHAAALPEDDPLRTHATVLMTTIDQFCSSVSLHGRCMHLPTALAVISDMFIDFVEMGTPSPD